MSALFPSFAINAYINLLYHFMLVARLSLDGASWSLESDAFAPSRDRLSRRKLVTYHSQSLQSVSEIKAFNYKKSSSLQGRVTIPYIGPSSQDIYGYLRIYCYTS